MQDLTVLLVQSDTVWENVASNLKNLSRIIGTQSADLIVLPETFSTGFSMRSRELAEPMNGATVQWMKQIAKSSGAVVTGSAALVEGDKIYNRLVWVTPDGKIDHYDKRHLIALMGEDKAFSCGHERKVFAVKGWRVCPQICYDLRFPVWSRNQDDYDALLYVANWPAARHLAWKTLLHARAIENQAYLIAVNRVGKDGNGLEFGGSSLVVNPLGVAVEELGSQPLARRVVLESAFLSKVRTDLPFLRDRDDFRILSD